MKRVLIFSLTYYPQLVGGAEVAIKEITDRVSPNDIEFHMVTLRFDSNLPKTERIGNVIVHRIGFSKKGPTIGELKQFPLRLNKWWYQFAAAYATDSLHRKFRFDGIWAMMAHAAGSPAGIFKTFHPEVSYLLTLQEGDPPEHIERLARPGWFFFVRAFTKADYLQPISNFLLAWARRMGFKGDARVIPNGVDIAHFAHEYAVDEIEAMKRKLGKKAGDVFLVTTSRLVHKNAVDDVINALLLLPQNIHFVVYGIGPEEEKLKLLAKKKNLEERVHFLGQVSHAEMPLALKACDMFIRPSRSEGMGNSFVEAMATGIPVIATQEGGIADFLFDAARNPDKETTGWAVDKDSLAGIASAVRAIVGNPGQVKKVTTTASKMVAERYDWELVARDMRELFSRMLGCTIGTP